MKKRLYGKEQFNTGKWSGGSTDEFAIFPENARYLERDFIWRLSSATVDVEESSFTRLPDYDRILLVLEGEAVLAHGEQRTVKLSAMEQDGFDGGIKTKCFGKIKDYNLMVRKGGSGRLHVLDAKSNAQPVPQTERGVFSHCSYGFYCASGYMVLSCNGETHMVKEGMQLVLDLEQGERIDMTLMGEGQVLFAEIFYDREEYVPEEIPAEKAGFDDFKEAFKLAFTRNKWSQAMKKNTDVWYDVPLQRALRKVDRTYITLILWIVGIIAAIAAGAGHLSEMQILGAAVLWSLLVFLLITPLIYMLVLPKPIRAHIKDVNRLTEYERKIYLTEIGENEMLEKVLKKYKNSGRTDRRDEEVS